MCCVVRWRVSSEKVFVDTVRAGERVREREKERESEVNAGEEKEKTTSGSGSETEIAIKYITGEK